MGRYDKEKEATLSRNSQLTATQKMVAEELAYKAFAGKTEEEIAGEAGINRSTIWRWKAIPEFNAEVNKIATEIQKSKQLEIYATLDKLLKSNNEKTQLKAIELLSRQLGLFKDSLQTEVKVETKVNVDDIMKELENM